MYLGPTEVGRFGMGTVARGLLPKLRELGCEVRRFPPILREGHHLITRWAEVMHASVPLGLRDLSLARFLLSRPVPLIQAVHGLPRRMVGNPGRGVLPRLAALLYDHRRRIGSRRADRVVVNSRYMARAVSELYSVEERRIAVIPNGVDLQFFRTEVEPFSWTGGPHILFVGRLHRNKGLDVLLRALPLIHREWPFAHLHAVGEGPFRGDFMELARELGLGGSVTFHGYVPREELRRYHRSAQLGVFPSLYEPFGITILEAMASGLPTVASATGGILELIEAGTNGLLVPPGDPTAVGGAIARLLRDPELARDLSLNAQSTASSYSWERVARDLISVYQELIGGEGGNLSPHSPGG